VNGIIDRLIFIRQLFKMKKLYILSCFLVFGIGGKAQMEHETCAKSCNHENMLSRPSQATYYQYPSLSKYDMKYLWLHLAVEPGSNVISGSSQLNVLAVSPMDSLILEFKDNMVVDSVWINGEPKFFTHENDHILIPLGNIFPIGAHLQSTVYYHGTANTGAVYNGTYNGLTYTASLSESYQAREWFPVKQILSDKIDSLDVWIKTSDGNKVGSNGLLVAVVDSPNNKKEFHWHSRHPIDYYLPSFSVGNYQEYINYAKPAAIAPDSIPIIHYVSPAPGYLDAIKPNLDKTPVLIEKYSALFGLYPFHDEKYGHCQANIGGGMEHQTMSTMVSFGSTLIAHELGHQWWGDNVTCATWNDIWLNEGFAEYSVYLAIEKLPSLYSFTSTTEYMQDAHDYVMSQPGGSVYVPNDLIFNENRIFSSRLSYDKGMAIIHTLRWEMQDDTLFFNTLKTYQNTYKNTVASATDFKEVAETISGKNLTDYFNEWYYGEGYPTFNITYFKLGSDSIVLLVNQTTSAPDVTPFFKGLYELTLQFPTGDTTVKIQLSQNNQLFRFHASQEVTNILVDPNNWVINAVGAIQYGGIIPVTLSEVNILAGADCQALVSWKASNESNLSAYIIEISKDGNSYHQVKTLYPHGDGYYSTEIPLATGHYFVRIKINNRDGSIKYSDILKVNMQCGKAESIVISPNPVHKNLAAQLWWNKDEIISIRVYNVIGQMVATQKQQVFSGSNSISIPTHFLSNGIYEIRVHAGQNNIVQRFLKE